MPDGHTLLSNADGTIRADGPDVLVCECRGDGIDLAVRRVATFALVVSLIIAGLVTARAAPFPIVFIAVAWSACAIAALLLVRRRRRLHGVFRLDFERAELTHEGIGFRRTFPIQMIAGVSTPPAQDAEADDPGLSPRWLLLHLSNGERLRLAKAPPYALGPALAFLRRAGIEP
ncbi:hypothetical protein SOCEGT47_050080 [Sorangium cellulosum]|uniref:DUF304 domain-containing protein n=1 Tax=Sorangium cellulosum TaxID=56 RepID=A0A4P2Q513_SORCE|nr:hypothetical protein [Sorangium cellulosum]AUX24470.1 hypothetical protein SOCEGT47_050080 [Sorangium cellulosum]